MKTERRHELQTNELANWLAGWVEAIAPYWKLMVGACLLLFAVWFAVAFVQSTKEKNRAQAWSSFFQAYEQVQGADPDSLTRVAQSHADTDAGLWALQSAADLHLAQGTQQLFRDRTQAKQDLDQARDTYESVVDQAKDPLLKQRAMFGLAQTLESLNDLGSAEQRYREIADTWPATAVGELAQERLEALQRPATQEWYSWFAKQEPVASRFSEFEGLQDLSNLPESPDISVPEPGQMLKPPATSSDGESTNEFQPFQLNTEDDSSSAEVDLPPSSVDESLPTEDAVEGLLDESTDSTDPLIPSEEPVTESP